MILFHDNLTSVVYFPAGDIESNTRTSTYKARVQNKRVTRNMPILHEYNPSEMISCRFHWLFFSSFLLVNDSMSALSFNI